MPALQETLPSPTTTNATPKSDPLLEIIGRWRAQRALINTTNFRVGQSEVDEHLLREWLSIEDAMVGVRPTTRAGMLAAVELVFDEVMVSSDQDYIGWLCKAARDFLRQQ